MPINEWAQWLWPHAMNHLWQATLTALLALALLRLARPTSARVRYTVLALALLRFVVPAAVVQALVHQTLIDHITSLTHFVLGVESGVRLIEFTAAFPLLTAPVEAVAAPHWPVWLSVGLLKLWFLGAIAALLFWQIRLWLAYLLLRGGQACESGAAYETFCRLRQWLGVRQSVTLWLMPQACEPCVWGWWRPRVILPADLLTQLNEDELAAILRHELWHVQRRDNWHSAVQMFIAGVFWFHPLVWWLDRCLTAETETLCDEAVVRFGSSPEIYARSLWKAAQVSLGWSSQNNSWAHHANLSRLITGTSLKERIKLMLNSNQFAENKWRSILRATVTLGGWATIALALALFSPKLTTAQKYYQSKDNGSEETVYEMKDVEERPKITHKEKAGYTKEARDNKVSGVIVLNAVFRKDGSITNIRVVRGLPHGLTDQAMEATQKIRFNPAQKGGQPVSVRANLEYSFQLE